MACQPPDDRGASLLEYAMLVALLGLVAIPAVLSLGESPRDKMCEAAFGVSGEDSEYHHNIYFDEESGKCCRAGVGFGSDLCL